MVYACIDVGSNTTRLLVAEVAGGGLSELLTERMFTRIGRGTDADGRIPSAKISECAAIIARQAATAAAAGAEEIVLVGTAAIREAPNAADLIAAGESASGLRMRVLSAGEEARLAFLGATETLGAPVAGEVVVLDVGGGSTEVAVGTLTGGVAWWTSLPVGSGLLADRYLCSDPPTASELRAARRHVADLSAQVECPHAGRAIAVGGSATSLRKLVGAELDREALGRAVGLLTAAPAAEVAARFELDPERVKLLPAGVLVLEALAAAVGQRLTIGRGGIREGAILELGYR